jgi:hypothetical protein
MPMTEYEQMQSLFVFLKMPNYPSKRWSDYGKWEIAKLLHNVILNVTKKVILAFSFLLVYANGITIVDNQSWSSIHCYMVAGWKIIPIMFALKQLEGGTTSNIKFILMATVMTFGGLTNEQNVKHLVCLSTDGISTFQGVRYKVITLLRTQHAPYFIGIHCMAHITNLIMQSLSSMPMVSKLEDLLQSLYGYFFNSPKGILNFRSLLKLWK